MTEWNMSPTEFPSPTGVNYYEYYRVVKIFRKTNHKEFPSPTGVTNYESSKKEKIL